MEYYTAIKREKVLIHATMWMNSENMLSEKAYGQEYVPFLSVTYNSQNWKTEFKSSLVWTRHVFPLSHKFSVCSWNVIVQILVISDNSSGAFPVAQW